MYIHVFVMKLNEDSYHKTKHIKELDKNVVNTLATMSIPSILQHDKRWLPILFLKYFRWLP